MTQIVLADLLKLLEGQTVYYYNRYTALFIIISHAEMKYFGLRLTVLLPMDMHESSMN